MVRPDFQVTADNASAVAAICARLDGLPLAIELAAARVKLLSPQAMLQRLDRRLALLTSGSRDLPLRQQTLRASIDWSYDLLDEGEQTGFRRLAVFVGGFTLEAAEEVVNGTEDRQGGRRTEAGATFDAVLTHLETLVNESLVQQREDGAGETRFTMLETIREYALERLEANGEAEVLRRRHAAYFLQLAEEAEPKLRGSEQMHWLKLLEREHHNIRAALVWAKDGDRTELLIMLAGAMWLFWYLRGYWSEGRNWLEEALRRDLHDNPTLPTQAHRIASRIKALNANAAIATAQGDFEVTQRRYEECLAIQRAIGDKQRVAVTLGQLGMVAYAQGDHGAARRQLEESVGLVRELGDRVVLGALLNNLGLVARVQGDYQKARAFYEESLTILRELKDTWTIARVLDNLGEVACDEGDYGIARSYLSESLKLSQELGDKWTTADALTNLGRVSLAQGNYAAAQQELIASLPVWQEVGHQVGTAASLKLLGEVAFRHGNANQARTYWERCLALFRELNDAKGLIETQQALAAIP